MDLGAARVKQAPRFRLKPVLHYVRCLLQIWGVAGLPERAAAKPRREPRTTYLEKLLGFFSGGLATEEVDVEHGSAFCAMWPDEGKSV
jgi:hypothetical protein